MTTTKRRTQNWAGKSGKVYQYEVYGLDTDWNDVPGNYIFVKLNSANRWAPLYIGETDSFKTRLPNHEKWPCVRQHGVTHIHAHKNSAETARKSEETDLRNAWPTPCNLQ